jgi:pyruvate formate lyase activating enzyme
MDHEPASCTLCGACVDRCPTGARQILGKQMTTSQVMDVVLRDRMFYDSSRGGMTVSGGEPLTQPLFLQQLLRAARHHSVHTALDTCGYTKLDTLLGIAPLVDLFLYDLKCMDDQRHKAYTGVSNRQILDNLQALASVHDNIWIRIPLIPGFNDEASLLKAAARFIASLSGVRQVNLLPHHHLGTSKSDAHQSARLLPRRQPLSQQQLEEASEHFQAAGLTTLIGG